MSQRDVSPGAEEADAAVVVAAVEPPPPDVEWWDRNLLATGSYEEDIGENGVAIKESKVSPRLANDSVLRLFSHAL